MPPAALVLGTYPAFITGYLSFVEAGSVTDATAKYAPLIQQFFESIPTEKREYRYAPEKWSIKEMLQHIIDAERIFCYRALRIARMDKTPLPGFNESDYARASEAERRSWDSLMEEFRAVRLSSDLLVKSFSEHQLQQSGTTGGSPNTTMAICYLIYGHILHHINVIKERYL